MAILLLFLALATLALLVALRAEVVWSVRRIQYLANARETGFSPRLSIIIPARNETETLEAALSSVVQQTYDNLEIIMSAR